jgi:type IV secretory pathway VirB4 component
VLSLPWSRLSPLRRRRSDSAPLAPLLVERRLRDLLLPGSVEETPDEVIVDGEFTATLAIIGYPRALPLDWLAPVWRAGLPVRVSLHLHPVGREAALRAIAGRRDDLDASRAAAAGEGRRVGARQELADEDNAALEAALEAEAEALLEASCYLTVSAETREGLRARTGELERALGRHGFRTARLRHAQLPGLVASLPLGWDRPRRTHPMTATAAAAAFPFAGAGATGRGVLLGVDPFGGGLVELFPFDRAARGAQGVANDHIVIAGMSGGGKSLTAKLIALRALPLPPVPARPEIRAEVWAVDRDGEYRALAEMVDGRMITLAPGRHGAGVNPLDLPPAPNEDDDGADAPAEPDPLAERASRVAGLIGLLAGAGGELTPRERTLASRAIAAAYAAAGVAADPATHARPMPTLADVQALLARGGGEARDLALRLEPYTHGPFAGVFARRTDVSPGGRVVTWDIRGLGDDARLEAAGLYLLTDAIWTAARRDRRPRLLLVDEAWKLIQHPAGAAMLADLLARGRKYGLAVVVITQEVRSLLESPPGYRLMVNAGRKILLGQDATALPLLAEAMGLGPGERDWLRTAEPGRALLLAGDERRAIRVLASPEELAALTTDPAEIAADPRRKRGAIRRDGELDGQCR